MRKAKAEMEEQRAPKRSVGREAALRGDQEEGQGVLVNSCSPRVTLLVEYLKVCMYCVEVIFL